MAVWYEEGAERCARGEARRGAFLFLFRQVALAGLAACWGMSGLSGGLAEGLTARWGEGWTWVLVYAGMVVFSVLAYEVVLFPLAVWEGGKEREENFWGWCGGYAITLALEVGFVTGGFGVLYGLMWGWPGGWWVAATVGYALVVVGVGVWGPALVLSRVKPPVEVEDGAFLAELRRVGSAAGLEITGAGYWDGDEAAEEGVVLTGTGRRRRVVFSAGVWEVHGAEGRLFEAARRMAGHKSGADLKGLALQTGLAALVFLGAGEVARAWGGVYGWSARSPEAFPFLAAGLFTLAWAAAMVLHSVERRADLRRDRFALRHAGGQTALVACLKAEFERCPFPIRVPWWQRWLLEAPTAEERLAQAQRLEKQNK